MLYYINIIQKSEKSPANESVVLNNHYIHSVYLIHKKTQNNKQHDALVALDESERHKVELVYGKN